MTVRNEIPIEIRNAANIASIQEVSVEYDMIVIDMLYVFKIYPYIIIIIMISVWHVKECLSLHFFSFILRMKMTCVLV